MKRRSFRNAVVSASSPPIARSQSSNRPNTTKHHQATKDSDLLDATRTYAMAGVAGVDARVCSMDAKYFYSTWRPVTAIPLGNG